MFLEPLDHVLSRNEFCSLRNALVFIRNTKIFVNGKRAFERNVKVDVEEDEISVDGKILEKQKHIYLLLNKPTGFVCAKDSDFRRTVYFLIPDEIKNRVKGCNLHSVGRLDADSSGLLLFTTNGSFSNFLTNPENHIEKTYEVRLLKNVDSENQRIYEKAFYDGIELPAYKHGKAFKTERAKLFFKNESECEVKISEGKFREIRRMFDFLGNEVVFLKRTAIGNLKLPEDLCEGRFIEIPRDLLEESLWRKGEET